VEGVDTGPLGLIALMAFPTAVAVGIGAVWAARAGRRWLMWLYIALILITLSAAFYWTWNIPA
jgi:hypothetical protein